MADKKMPTCGDCIHADICKQVNGAWFSPNNPAYCKGFKDRTNYVEVVRCKDCYYFTEHNDVRTGRPLGFGECHRTLGLLFKDNDFCTYGERRTNERTD